MYKKLYTSGLCLLFSMTVFLYLQNRSIICVADTTISHNTEENTKIGNPIGHQNQLEKEIEMLRKDLYQSTIQAYNRNAQATEHLINVILLIATIFGIIIALAGVLIGFESIRSRQRSEKATETVEKAQEYVEQRTAEFDKEIKTRMDKITKEFKGLSQASLDQLSQDAAKAAEKVKEMTEKGMSTEAEKKVELLEKRIKFFDEIGIPEDPKVLFSKAMMLKKKEMPKESLELLKKAIEHNPDYKSAYWQIGWIQSEIGNDEESLKAYNEVIRLDSKDSSAYNNRGAALGRLGKKELALESYNKAIELNPDNPLYYENKAETLVNLDRIEDACSIFNKKIDLAPNDLHNYWAIGRILAENNKIDEAREYYRRTGEIEEKKINTQPDDEENLLNYFENLLILGDYKKSDAFEFEIKDKDRVKSLKYLYVFKFLISSLSFLRNNKTDGFKQAFQIVKDFDKSPLEEASDWRFEDINPFLKLKLDKNIYQACLVIEELLRKEISAKECKVRIQKLKKMKEKL